MREDQKYYTVRGYQLLRKNKKLLTSGMEDYLEMIYRNSIEAGYMRVNKLAEQLNVQPSSATKMVQKLAGLGLIKYQKYGIIELTERGLDMGNFLLNRHKTLEKFLRFIGCIDVLSETELIEHSINIDTLKNIDSLNRFIEKNPSIQKKFEKFKEELNYGAI
ncbi:iron dependent repressor, metal binding and dimerization domain protein [Herbivorax sp. ANBcel31]|uniref:metal-dependent transcriptional regulator n=1 Tax=Herbivorax sp. ANBcel31 TaxID=3069754 RepID=UPI0027AFE6F0|nr:iron dependent repressor, metal binding and dimerization domain protein [Herbivorax sp. ANBcel31]MDQ2086614.1 iron dependent repressor, metal binding and dimerization domain protein [Herbivorax sp. ANBcel31]